MGQIYKYNNREYEYYYDNDDDDYLLDEDIEYASSITPPLNTKEKDARRTIVELEKLKGNAIIGKLSQEKFMKHQIELLNGFNSKWDEFLLDTEYAVKFYHNLNLYLENKGE